MSRSFKTARREPCFPSYMANAALTARAATPLVETIHNITPSQLSAQTPCAEYDVGKLVNHLLFWGPSLEGAALKESVAPPAETEAAVDLTRGEWAVALQMQLQRITAAWSEPGAWQGLTRMGGPMDMPASLIGGTVIGELVVHGWDLARATDQHPAWDEDLLRYVHEEVANSAEQGRQMGIYGPEVTVPASHRPWTGYSALPAATRAGPPEERMHRGLHKYLHRRRRGLPGNYRSGPAAARRQADRG